MPLSVRNDEQIRVGTTPGLVVGASSFTFDGTATKPDYRYYEIVISELTGRGILVKGLDYSWDPILGLFTLLQNNDIFADLQYYNIHFQRLAQPITDETPTIINNAFFIRDITIPNIESIPTIKNAPVLERLNAFIVKYEAECLENILGYELYKSLLTEASPRITELMFGAEYYDIYTRLRKWKGLVFEHNQSLIANYIYFYFQKASALQTTGVNTTKNKSEAGQSVSPEDKMISAWNFFSKQTYEMVSFLRSTVDLDGINPFPEFTSYQACITQRFARTINVFDF